MLSFFLIIFRQSVMSSLCASFSIYFFLVKRPSVVHREIEALRLALDHCSNSTFGINLNRIISFVLDVLSKTSNNISCLFLIK